MLCMVNPQLTVRDTLDYSIGLLPGNLVPAFNGKPFCGLHYQQRTVYFTPIL